MTKKIFFSYDYDRHRNYKNLIKAWEIRSYVYPFTDISVDTSINSDNTTYIKSKIDESNAVFVIVGDYTSSNKWVDWEIEYAMSRSKRIVVIKTEEHLLTPKKLINYNNCTQYIGFNLENVQRAVSYS